MEAAVRWETVGAKEALIVCGAAVVSAVTTVVVTVGTEGVLEALEVVTAATDAAVVGVMFESSAD